MVLGSRGIPLRALSAKDGATLATIKVAAKIAIQLVFISIPCKIDDVEANVTAEDYTRWDGSTSLDR
jgi:hypothetical protein